MNHLAHCWLAQGNDGHVAGGFLGDFYKGPVPRHLPEELQEGIRLHRHIDTLTNQLPEFRSTYARFGPELRRVAPILLDLIADHLLARHWHNHGTGALTDFTAKCYRIIERYEIPELGRRAFDHVVSRDLWCRYSDLNVVLSVMGRILSRLRMDDRVLYLGKLEPQMGDFYRDFCEYFPIILQAVDKWKSLQSVPLKRTKSSFDESNFSSAI